MLKPLYIFYLVLIFIYSYKISADIKNKIFHIGLFIWIIGAPIIGSKLFTISIPGLFFDFHLQRILICVFSILLFHEMFKRKWIPSYQKKLKLIAHPFEKWFVIFFIVIFISTLMHVIDGNITVKQFIRTNTNQFFVLFIYFCFKLFSEIETKEKFKKTIVILSVFLSCVAIIQSFVFSEFFRFGVRRIAFGDTLRASGFFHNEYTLGFYCIIAIIIMLTSEKPNIIAIALNCFAVLLTFHRLSIGIMFLSISLYLVANRHKKATHVVILLTILLVSCISYFLSIKGYSFVTFKKTNMYTSRFAADTFSGRVDQYINAISVIKDNFFGLGSYDTSKYYKFSAKIGQIQYKEIYDYDKKKVIGIKRIGMIVHNGFLGAGTRYGVLGLISFLMFCLSSVAFFYHNFRKTNDNESLSILLICVAWLLYQTTQDFSGMNSYHGIYFVIVLALFTKSLNHKPLSKAIS